MSNKKVSRPYKCLAHMKLISIMQKTKFNFVWIKDDIDGFISKILQPVNLKINKKSPKLKL